MSDVDAFVGQKIRARRIELGKSQDELATAIGVTFQQVQKYETGANRVSASRLWAIAEELRSPIEYFFEGAQTNAQTGRVGDKAAAIASDLQSLNLVRQFQTLPDSQRRAILAIVKSMAGDDAEPLHELSTGETQRKLS